MPTVPAPPEEPPPVDITTPPPRLRAIDGSVAPRGPRASMDGRAPQAARLSGRAFLVLGAIVGLVAVYATDQVVPATSAHQAELRIWLAARAAGFVTLGLLTIQVTLGLVLSHPTNKTTWQLSRLLFPWHENLWVFVLSFLAMHVVTIVADPYAGVGIGGALVPGLSGYRTAPVALGVLALYALLITGLTARYTTLLPRGIWLKLHRLSLGILALAWGHGVLSGTDSVPMSAAYGASFALVLAAVAYRYWVARTGRPTFSTDLLEANP
jgi:methionine sulfoxide reductase heme-binding subunit